MFIRFSCRYGLSRSKIVPVASLQNSSPGCPPLPSFPQIKAFWSYKTMHPGEACTRDAQCRVR
uniref:Uncharacterized protein n=1 Tax=Manihot esculenta TaxID=3983 RepID=A0A2C9VIJ5_MANES